MDLIGQDYEVFAEAGGKMVLTSSIINNYAKVNRIELNNVITQKIVFKLKKPQDSQIGI